MSAANVPAPPGEVSASESPPVRPAAAVRRGRSKPRVALSSTTLVALFERFFASGDAHDAATAAAADAAVAQLSHLEAVPAEWGSEARAERVAPTTQRQSLLGGAQYVLDIVRQLPGTSATNPEAESTKSGGAKGPGLLNNIVYAAGAATGVVQGVASFTLNALGSARHDDDDESQPGDDADADLEIETEDGLCRVTAPAPMRKPPSSYMEAVLRPDISAADSPLMDRYDSTDSNLYCTPQDNTPASSVSSQQMLCAMTEAIPTPPPPPPPRPKALHDRNRIDADCNRINADANDASAARAAAAASPSLDAYVPNTVHVA